MIQFLALLVSLGIVCAPIIDASAYTIILDSETTLTTATTATGSDHIFSPSLPYASTAMSNSSQASAAATYDLTNEGFNILFDVRAIEVNNSATVNGAIYFSVDEDVRYEVSGLLAAVDPIGRRTSISAEFFRRIQDDSEDPDADENVLLVNLQTSAATPNERFVIGESGGDAQNINIGARTGTLLAGEEYQFFYRVDLGPFVGVGNPGVATATGNFTLGFTPVPEPNTAFLLGLGLAALGTRRRQ